MRLSQIRNILATVQAGSMRGAARILGVAQPDLTRSIRELEEELGLKLLERSSRGVVPTRAGKAFLARARNVQNELGRMREEAAQMTGNSSAVVSFGVGPMSSRLISDAIPAFRRRFPKAEVRIVSGYALTLLSQLREGLIEFAVTQLPPSRQRDKDIRAAPLSRDWRVIAGRRGHPLRDSRTLDRLVEADWLLQSPAEIKDEQAPWWFVELFEKNGLAPPRSLVRCEGHVHTSLLLTTDMISVVPPESMLFGLGLIEAFKANACRPASCMYTEYLVQRPDTPLTPAAAALASSIKAGARARISAKSAR